ncbi:MAG: GNAT family N-acetyltransferase [Aeromicrobium sp.]
MQVREAIEDEWEAVGDLTVAGYDANGYLTYPDGTFDDGYAGWLRDAASRGCNSVLLVAVDGDDLLGTVSWCPPGSPDRQVSTSDAQGEFRTLSVAADARGRGVGRALVTDCFDRARSAGLTEMVLCSLPDMKPAHQLYETFGFTRRPESDWSPEPGVTLWVFAAPVT